MTDRSQNWTPATPKPEGPVWVDFEPMLTSVSVKQLVQIANHALNQLTLRQIGEITYDAGINPNQLDLRLTPLPGKEESQ